MKRSIKKSVVAAMFCCGFIAAATQLNAENALESPLSFRDDVRPILSNHCFACHGPDEEHREAGVRLDVADDVDLEEVIARITSTDPDLVMPPPELHKPLNDGQVKTLTRWIEQDAPYEQHWAFVSPAKPAIPRVANGQWSDQSLDQFVLAELERRGRDPSVPADRRTLIRRLSLDLTGLPPTRDQIAEFLADESDQAYQNLVTRLISAPAFGEHMARYWLDLVRFADTNGLHHDHYREMTLYRDWVIRSFNHNVPFDEFITYQLAGDLFAEPTNDQLIASGFNRLHLIIDRGTALPEESAFRNVVDRVSSVGTAFMGLTMQCAVCHDHKYDPITQKDFYQMSAFFNNFDGDPETGRRGTINFRRGLQEPFLEIPTPQQARRLGELDADLKTLQTKLVAWKKEQADLQKSVQKSAKKNAGKQSSPEKPKVGVDGNANTQANATTAILADVQRELTNQRLVALSQAIKRTDAARSDVAAQRDELLLQIPATLVMKEREEIRPMHLRIRGAYDQLGDEVQRDAPGFLPPMKTDSPQKTRMDLADWLTDPQNPLTARVAVNRFWQQFFGVGLVRTSEDFGSQGETPSHPELLDHMTTEFVQSGWDVKALVRRMVMSQTYRQSSTAEPEQFLSDPQNRVLGRGSRFRLDAEVVRDQWLSVSGLLNKDLFGKSVKPPQPAGLWKIVAMPTSYPSTFEADRGDAIHRRSVYTFWKRGLPPPQMTVFDAPTRESCIARRERTNTPLQALLLMNEEQHFAAAKHLAENLIQDTGDDRQKIVEAYETITSHLPNDDVISKLATALSNFRQLYANDHQLAKELVRHSDLDVDQSADLAAWTMVVHSLLNLDAIRTRE